MVAGEVCDHDGMLRFLLRILLDLASIPGVIAHELGHQVACWLTGTRVREVCYFRFGLPPGYVVHDRPATIWRHLIVASGPFALNTLLGLGLGWLARQGHSWVRDPFWTRVVLTWLAVAVAMHAFPSLTDANNVMEDIWRKGVRWYVRLLATPLGGLLYLGAFAGWIWLDLAWGLVVGVWLPGRWPLS